MHRRKRRALLHRYSITSSAKASNVAGTVRTSTLAAVICRSCYNKAPDLEHGFHPPALLTYLVLGRSDMPLSSFAAYSLAQKVPTCPLVVRSPEADRITSSRVGNDLAFPRQRSKSPREQRFAAVVSDGDHLL